MAYIKERGNNNYFVRVSYGMLDNGRPFQKSRLFHPSKVKLPESKLRKELDAFVKAVGSREIIVMESFDDENLLNQESREGCNVTQGIKLSEQYGELLSKTTQSYTCTRKR